MVGIVNHNKLMVIKRETLKEQMMTRNDYMTWELISPVIRGIQENRYIK